MRNYLREDEPFHFSFPIDGDCVNERDGVAIPGGIRIPVSVSAPEEHTIEVNGVPTRYEKGAHRAYADILGRENLLIARDITDGTEISVRVFRLPNAVGGYRLSSDDNILFLWDINEHKDEYKSIFENPYLAVYKKAHDLYGAKAHLNLFYEFDEEAAKRFGDKRPYFNLSMMTDKFKDEFRANADWLKLTFHAKHEHPMKPYQFADGETVRKDCEQIHAEIVRFAGEEVISDCTTVHFGEANEEGARELRSLGYRAMTGYFFPDAFCPVAYYAPNDLIKHIYDRDFWYDTETDILFGRIDIVLNCNTHEFNLNALREITASPTRGGFVSIMIHEQYFYEDYRKYLPDFETRILDSCKLLAESGYIGRHIIEAAGLN